MHKKERAETLSLSTVITAEVVGVETVCVKKKQEKKERKQRENMFLVFTHRQSAERESTAAAAAAATSPHVYFIQSSSSGAGGFGQSYLTVDFWQRHWRTHQILLWNLNLIAWAHTWSHIQISTWLIFYSWKARLLNFSHWQLWSRTDLELTI